MRLEGRHFLISGGASGLGKGAAEAVIGKGAKVTILDRDEDLAQSVVKELGTNASYVVCDLTDEESIKKALESLKWPEVHGLVNCAGTGYQSATVSRKGKVHDMGPFEWIIKLNLLGNFSLASKVAGKMAKNEPVDGERGVIVNVASVAAMDGQNGQAAYSGSKGGIVALSLPMARDLSHFGIRVNCIAPGVFSTPLSSGLIGTNIGKGLLNAQAFPNERFGTGQEFGHAVVFLLENGFMNAECIRLDAGTRMPKL